MRPLVGDKLRLAMGIVILSALSADYWHAGRVRIRETLARDDGAVQMTAGDSAHYLEIARGFARGDLRFAYVAPAGGPDLAHRQPLYPAMLAAAMRIGGDRLPYLASVNLVVMIAALWVVYAIGVHVFASQTAGITSAVALWYVPFLFENATTRLLTEPGYVCTGLLAAWGFLAYLASPRRRALVLASCGCALVYLQRVNGLFLAVSALSVLAMDDVRRTRRIPDLARRAPNWWAHALLTLVLFTAPSWAPRLVYAGNPFYHGYLANYLWVDAYERAHVPGPPRYDWRDYVREHDVGDAVSRMGYGLRRTLWEAPRAKYGSAVAAAMLVGAVLVVLTRKRAACGWLVVGLLQVLPLAWTSLSNPVKRIPAAALLPFGLIAIAAGTAGSLALARRLGRMAAGPRFRGLEQGRGVRGDRSES